MYTFGLLLFFAAVIVPPILATKGKGRRGVWVAQAFAGLLLALLFFAVIGQAAYERKGDVAGLAAGLTWIFFGSFLGGIFAACLYRKRDFGHDEQTKSGH